MYIWIALDVNEQVLNIRQRAENYVNKHKLNSPTFTLPFHISLKIAFKISNEIKQMLVSDICDFCKLIKPFTIPVKAIEQNGNIIWLTMQDCKELTILHDKLDQLLLEKYGVTQHEFDKSFIFHTSIIILNNETQTCNAFNQIKNTAIPTTLKANKIIIGSSESGKAGTYCVNQEILL